MLKRITTASLAALMLATALSAGVRGTKEFKDAVALYEKGMYVEARQAFEQIARQSGAEDAEGYAVLCAVRLQAPGYQTLIEKFDSVKMPLYRDVLSYTYPEI